ncbi:MAG: tRNA pseudouridine(38-40) synthase TruA [Cytophagales bacterium]
MQKYFLEISYLGSNYSGWQIQENAFSAQQCVQDALETFLRHEVSTLGSGRTDAGVHARQQFVQFSTNEIVNSKAIIGLNAILPNDISVKNIFKVPNHASARFDAQRRKYIYRISPKKNPFFNHISYFFPHQIDLELMSEAASKLIAYKDFGCFCKSNSDAEHFLCDIFECNWKQEGELILFHVAANRFLRGMVRAMVGTFLDVGQKKISVSQFEEIIKSGDRTRAGRNVPPEGLTLEEVIYPDGFLEKI